jgi:lipoprotein-anchoring transpeptidase ErfK/SrfK
VRVEILNFALLLYVGRAVGPDARVRHGCIRMPNRRFRRLERVMPLGTPVTVR